MTRIGVIRILEANLLGFTIPATRSYNKPNTKQFKHLINFQKLIPTCFMSRNELFCMQKSKED